LDSDSSAQTFLKLFTKFRKSVWFRVFYLAILALVVVALFQFSTGSSAVVCLGILLSPVSVFVLPYYLGERRVKHFLINAVPVFLAALLIVGVFTTNATLDMPAAHLQSEAWKTPPSAISLWNGTVVHNGSAPATAGQPFIFRVKVLTNASVNTSRLSVFVNLSSTPLNFGSYSGVRMMKDASANNSNGTWYALPRTLGPDITAFFFYANDSSGHEALTTIVIQPITAPYAAYYGFWIVYLAQAYFSITIVFYLLIVFMTWYSARNRRLRQRMMSTETLDKLEASKKAKPAEPVKAAPETKASKAAAFTCTNCGADVTEDDDKCPKCGAVFED
jgi:hypothetical protein